MLPVKGETGHHRFANPAAAYFVLVREVPDPKDFGISGKERFANFGWVRITHPIFMAIQVSDTEIRQRLAAILAADVAGYSRLMAADDRATVAALDTARKVFRAQIESNQGRVIDGGAYHGLHRLRVADVGGVHLRLDPKRDRLRFGFLKFGAIGGHQKKG